VFVDNFEADNCGAWSNIEMTFLPPNTRSVLQPCDQGFSKYVKIDYRKKMLQRICDVMWE